MYIIKETLPRKAKEKHMGVFSRFLDIVNANINSLLDKAEDPEKMVKLMMQEMEDTLIELKSSCADSIAAKNGLDKRIRETEAAVQRWIDRAKLALDKGKEDLAREALVMKKQTIATLEQLKSELTDKEDIVTTCRENIRQVEEKLAGVREKFDTMKKEGVQRTATGSKSYTSKDREFENRFSQMDDHLEKMGGTYQNYSLDKEFENLEQMDEIEAELETLKKGKSKGSKS